MKPCKNCCDCKYYVSSSGQCYAQKNAPRVDVNDSCENFKAAHGMCIVDAILEIKKWINGCPFDTTKDAFNLAIKGLEFINENYPSSFEDFLDASDYM